MFNLTTPIENLYLVGPARAKLLKKLELNTLGDLLFYFPRKHHDLSKITDIKDLRIDEIENIKARVLEIKSFKTKIRRITLTHALVEDDTASLLCVWYNQPFLNKTIKPHEQYLFSGKVIKDKGKLTMQNPVYEQEKKEQVHTARLVPIYSLTASLTQKQLRTIIKTYLDKTAIPDYLPKFIVAQENLLDEHAAVNTFHFPHDYLSLQQAQKRLSFDEIFQTQIRVMRYKLERTAKSGFQIANPDIVQEKIKALPFSLTDSQKQALDNILSDFRKPYPANRLLEGEVGSGKTIVAALAMSVVAKNNFQSALLAPTEVLAQQHYTNLLKLFTDDQLDIALLTANSVKLNGNPVSKNTLLTQIKLGNPKIVIGTHALLQKGVFSAKGESPSGGKNLAFVVIDEQHRFGVEQRSSLKINSNAHLLTMSATPIPRTLALTLYGDLDISILKQMPLDRKPIKTWLVPEAKRRGAYDFIHKEINNGRQAFVICPLVTESDKLGVKSATAEYKKLSEEIYPHLNIGLLHGKLKPKEKEETMRQFQAGDLQILVSTSVIEVGVDVPNATVMMIEGAERFGLAQLHQFRGRVGRSKHQSYCFLFSDDQYAQDNLRLKAVTKSTNGFELAEMDLQIRGSGDLYGTAQSGYGFRIATLANLEMVQKSRNYALKLLEQDPTLASHPLLKEQIDKQPLVHLE
ncbi:MAG: ATP-dependent DNA helicase RecG [Candidatus Doudnabacteria bacterium]|nr:ATP-dependent DNA helicase RecG [Candidatus Doudnabacteria bacterium]